MKYAILSILFVPALVFANAIERISVTEKRQETERRFGSGQFDVVNSNYNAISADGRYVVYSSSSETLVPNDTNGVQDTFCYDRKTGELERISVGSLGEQSDVYSAGRKISDDGRYILMVSAASALVPGGGNGETQVLLKDRKTGSIELISKDLSGNPVAMGASAYGMSPDARYVTISSKDDNLVANDTNTVEDTFLIDRQTGDIERVNLTGDGSEINGFSATADMSDDARYFVFLSRGTNFATGLNGNGSDMQAYLRDRTTGAVSLITTATDGDVANGWSGWLHISGDGSMITFAGPSDNLVASDTNTRDGDPSNTYGSDVFVVPTAQAGTPGAIRLVSIANDGTTQGNSGSWEPEISRNGDYLVFFSEASNLTDDGDTNGSISDVLYVDLNENTIERISNGVDGTQGDDHSTNCTLNASGQIILFHSRATNLVPNDTNRDPVQAYSGQDVFVVQRQQAPPTSRSITDIDTDGLDDDWEIQHFGDLRFLASDDPDGDGHDNAAEHAAATNPFGFEVTLKRGWNVVSLSHAMKHRHYSEFLVPAVAKGRVWNAHRQDGEPAFDLAADKGVWLFDNHPSGNRTVPIALP